MLDNNTTAPQETVETTQSTRQHPYTVTDQEHVVCESGDKECLLRLVAAFSDCA